MKLGNVLLNLKFNQMIFKNADLSSYPFKGITRRFYAV